MSYSGSSPRPIEYCVASVENGQARTLISDSCAFQASASGLADFAISCDGLAVPNCHILIAVRDGEALGCVALLDELHYGEIAHLYLREGARGQGISRGLLREAEHLASELGLRVLRAKTCAGLQDALTLCQAHGFSPCAAYGHHTTSPAAVFLEKHLL